MTFEPTERNRLLLSLLALAAEADYRRKLATTDVLAAIRRAENGDTAGYFTKVARSVGASFVAPDEAAGHRLRSDLRHLATLGYVDLDEAGAWVSITPLGGSASLTYSLPNRWARAADDLRKAPLATSPAE